jgi:predicted CXXCH cytochrome family protein
MTRTLFIRILLCGSITCCISFFWGIEKAFPVNDIEEEMVNPHFTGTNCGECHLQDAPQGKGAPLQFNGDSVKLCNRCHETEFARTDIHPVDVILTDAMKKIVPGNFPLENGKVTCLTCHDALFQMKDDFARKTTNPAFIRGAPYEMLAAFCFLCHRQEEYKKTNPHKQRDEQGNSIEGRCLFCHQSLPDPVQVKNMGEVTFKSELALYCVNCHPQQKTHHPARANHLIPLPDFLNESLPVRLAALQVELPLDGERIFCGTCHNPHEKGVIKRKEAGSGAGEEFFLRLNGGYVLCVTCHQDKTLAQSEGQTDQKDVLPDIRRQFLSTHKPVAENKCKLCHVITPETRERPKAMFLCFKEGCHKTELLDKEFVHEKTVVENCYLCHRSHSSVYEKLLKDNKEGLCRSCHPLLRDKRQAVAGEIENEQKSEPTIDRGAPSPDLTREENGGEEGISEDTVDRLPEGEGGEEQVPGISLQEYEKSSKEHTVFTEYLKITPVPEGSECGFCHSPYHKAEIGRLEMETCAKCHIFVHGVLSRASAVPLTLHDTFQEKSCTACHDAHSAPYPYILKEPPESYLPDEVGSESGPSLTQYLQ